MGSRVRPSQRCSIAQVSVRRASQPDESEAIRRPPDAPAWQGEPGIGILAVGERATRVKAIRTVGRRNAPRSGAMAAELAGVFAVKADADGNVDQSETERGRFVWFVRNRIRRSRAMNDHALVIAWTKSGLALAQFGRRMVG